MRNALKEFESEFEKATQVTGDWLLSYSAIYDQARILNKRIQEIEEKTQVIRPNSMQKEALVNLEKLRQQGANKALSISATGTGKTYLSAFDVAVFNPHRCLFIVHRRNIAEAAMKTFKDVFGRGKTWVIK